MRKEDRKRLVKVERGFEALVETGQGYQLPTAASDGQGQLDFTQQHHAWMVAGIGWS